MFTTREAILEKTGVDVDNQTLATAQMMVEAYIGKVEQDITDAGDTALLGRAVTFQAIYINGQVMDILELVAQKSTSIGETTSTFQTELMAPFMSPWAAITCRRLTWMGTRSVHTGPVFDRTRYQRVWERD